MEPVILIAESQPILREGLALRLAEEPGFRVAGTAGDVDALEDLLARHPEALAVVDMEMAPAEGPCAIERARARGRVVALSESNARVKLEQAMAAGASGYVLKTGPYAELVQALGEVAAGRHHVSREASRYLVDAMHAAGRRSGRAGEGPRDGAFGFDLTRRERQVLLGIASGHSCPELAVELGISARTVERHRASLMAKLDIHKTAKLVRFAVREGLVAA